MFGPGSLVWLFSPAWDAVKLTLPGGWLHLSFRGHRPYLGATTVVALGLMLDNFLPDAESRAFLPFGIKASRVCCATSQGH